MATIKRFPFLIILFVFGYSLGALGAYLQKPYVYTSSPVLSSSVSQNHVASYKPSIKKEAKGLDLESLEQNLKKLTDKNKGLWGIVFKDLNSNKQILLNEHKLIYGASLTKVITAVSVLDKIEKNKIKFTPNIEKLITAMINRSDNDSWETLNYLVGFNFMQALGKELGMANLNVYGNELTPEDMTNLLDKLYRGDILSETNREFLFALMQDTETEDRIPAGVPENIQVIHKTGTLDDNIHDAGIILTERPYILVVMSKNTNRKEGTKIIQEVSKTIFDHFTRVETL